MVVPHDASLAASALQLLNSALGALKQTRETAKNIKDSSIKEQINTIYDYVIELKEKILELKEENAELNKRLGEKQSVRRDSRTGYIYKGDDSDPFCPKCYQTTGKSIHLAPPYNDLGRVTRYCRACNENYADPE